MYLDEGFLLLDCENKMFPVLYHDAEDAVEDMIRGDFICEGLAVRGECGHLIAATTAEMAELN